MGMRPKVEDVVLVAALIAVAVGLRVEGSFVVEAAVLAVRIAAILLVLVIANVWRVAWLEAHRWAGLQDLDDAHHARLPLLRLAELSVVAFDFERVEELAIRSSPDTTCFAYTHPHQPESVCLYHMGHRDERIEIEIRTRFANGMSLTTFVGRDRYRDPLPPGQFVQVFEEQLSFKTALHAHWKARRFLTRNRLVPVRLDGPIRDDLVAAHRETVAHGRAKRFWYLRDIVRAGRRPHDGYLGHQPLPFAELLPRGSRSRAPSEVFN